MYALTVSLNFSILVCPQSFK